MGIFFPDNDKRHARLVELSSDAQTFLTQAKAAYNTFKNILPQANDRVAQVYRKANLMPPSVTSMDILQAQKSIHQIATDQTIVDFSKVIIDVGGFVASTFYLAPAATAALVDAGVIAEETASAVLFSVLGSEVTAGALAGGIIGGLVVGVVVVGIGLAIDAIEGAHERDELRKGIHDTDKLRAQVRLSLDKSTALVKVLESIIRTCNSLLETGLQLTDQVIQNIIQRDAIPSLRALEAIDKDSVLRHLRIIDESRHSWTQEDDAGADISLPKSVPIYINAGFMLPENRIPFVPSGLKLIALSSPDGTETQTLYPVFRVDNVTYWPLSFVDNRVGMAIVAFDSRGKQVRTFEKSGARYIFKIEQDVLTNDVVFVGQQNLKITVKWSELTDISVIVSTRISRELIPPRPKGIKATALANLNNLSPAAEFPILQIGHLRYFPLSFSDNRLGLYIIAYDDNNKGQRLIIKYGARYIYEIREHIGTKIVSFICQDNKKVDISYSELAT